MVMFDEHGGYDTVQRMSLSSSVSSVTRLPRGAVDAAEVLDVDVDQFAGDRRS